MTLCLECGKRLNASLRIVAKTDQGISECRDAAGPSGARPGRSAEFCSRACRSTFNNRRASRGAELYDLIMVARFERPLAATLKVWGWIARLASQYRDEDRAEREGRPSWRHPREIAARRPWIAGRVLVKRRVA